MNHRTGKLTSADFEPARALPAPSWFIDQVEHTSDFGVIDAGATFMEPAPQRDMFDVEREHPWLVVVYFGVLFGAVLLCHWFAGGFA